MCAIKRIDGVFRAIGGICYRPYLPLPTHNLSHTHSLSHTHTHTHRHTQTHPLSLSHTHTHTLTLPLTVCAIKRIDGVFRAIGGICYRPYLPERLGEIAFCAIKTEEQVAALTVPHIIDQSRFTRTRIGRYATLLTLLTSPRKGIESPFSGP